MKTNRGFGRYALLLTSLVLAFTLLAKCSLAEGVNGQNDDIPFVIDMDTAGEEYIMETQYYVSLHNRIEAYHPAAVLISGFVYAQMGTEIHDAGVEAGGLWFPAQAVYRFTNQRMPDLKDMLIEVDTNRSAFAFLVDLSDANLQDGYKIKMTVCGAPLAFGDYKIAINSDCYPYTDISHALEGYIAKAGEYNEAVFKLQGNLVETKYMDQSQVNGIYDEKTRLAIEEFCKANTMSESEIEKCRQGITQAVFIRTSSSDALPKPNEIIPILDFLQNEVFSLSNFSVELWMLVAAGALLIAVILVLILVLTRKKKTISYIPTSNELASASADDSGLVIMEDTDGPTEDLGKINVGSDGVTEELPPSSKGFQIMLRLFYDGMYINKTVRLAEGEKAVVGRNAEADIQTNPNDKSVSGKHGIFIVRNNTVVYQDNQSRNGTKVGESMFVGKAKDRQSIDLPLNTKITMEIGTHKIWVLIKQEE